MNERLLKYLQRLKSEEIGALSGNPNGVLEVSIGLRKDRSEDDKSDEGYMIRYSRLVIMFNLWELRDKYGRLEADNFSAYPSVEKLLMELDQATIDGVEAKDSLDKIEILTEKYLIRSNRNKGFEMLIHDFDYNSTLAVDDTGDIKITSRNKEFPF